MYSKYAELRDKQGLSDYAVSKLSGVGRSTLSDWKTGKHIPNTENLSKIAAALGVSINYFISSEAAAENYYTDPETAKIAQELFDSPDMRMLFDAAKDSRPEDLQMAADMLKRFKETNPNG